MKRDDLSFKVALVLMISIAFHAQPTVAAFANIIIFIIPLLFLYTMTVRFEAYKQAMNEYAPGKEMQGHPLYKAIDLLERSYFGVRGIWFVMGLVVLVLIYRWWFH